MIEVIYADNAATTKMNLSAFEAMKPYMLEEYGNASQPYSFSRTAKAALKKARIDIAKCINADLDEIFFTSGGTEGDSWAIKGIAAANLKKGKHIITSQIEHHAILNSCKSLEILGYDVDYLPVDKCGMVDPENIKKAIKSDTILISIMMANNEIGTLQKVKEVAEIAHDMGIAFHTDAVQAVGHIPIDVKYTQADFLTASAHKFNGPKGVGFFYKNSSQKIQPLVNGGSQEYSLRAGTENIAGIVGMAKALTENISTLQADMNYVMELENKLLCELKNSNIDFIHNGGEKRLPGLISLSIKNMNGEAILHRMDLSGIVISTGSACDSQNIKVSHVIKAINIPLEYAHGTIRISLGKYNSQDDVKRISDELKKICQL